MHEYKPPFKLAISEAVKNISSEIDKVIYEAVLKADIVVDRDELIRALEYDRNQFRVGYECGKLDKEFTIDDLKRALVEVRDICKQRDSCIDCPMSNPFTRTVGCRLCDIHIVSTVPPMDWRIDECEEDTHETD